MTVKENTLPEWLQSWMHDTQRKVFKSGEKNSVSVQRYVDHAPAAVWTACTDATALGQWLGHVEGDFREGGALKMQLGVPGIISSTILECKPPQLLRISWLYEGSADKKVEEVVLELVPQGEGTLMELQHHSHSTGDWWLYVGTGWEYTLMLMDLHIQGKKRNAVPEKLMDTHLQELWKKPGVVLP